MDSPALHLQMTDDGNELEGLCLLVVEDDYLVAADMCSALMRRGAIILGPASNLRRSRELLRQQRPDCALLDLNLNGTLAFELAEEFRRESIATIFTTGYDAAFFPDSFRNSPCLQKPVNFTTLVQLIRNNAHAAQQA
jgi:DNA-binding response OmpR family regulator